MGGDAGVLEVLQARVLQRSSLCWGVHQNGAGPHRTLCIKAQSNARQFVHTDTGTVDPDCFGCIQEGEDRILYRLQQLRIQPFILNSETRLDRHHEPSWRVETTLVSSANKDRGIPS